MGLGLARHALPLVERDVSCALCRDHVQARQPGPAASVTERSHQCTTDAAVTPGAVDIYVKMRRKPRDDASESFGFVVSVIGAQLITHGTSLCPGQIADTSLFPIDGHPELVRAVLAIAPQPSVVERGPLGHIRKALGRTALEKNPIERCNQIAALNQFTPLNQPNRQSTLATQHPRRRFATSGPAKMFV